MPDFLLQENGDFLLQENGDRIILEFSIIAERQLTYADVFGTITASTTIRGSRSATIDVFGTQTEPQTIRGQ